jgi:hypothetical protein
VVDWMGFQAGFNTGAAIGLTIMVCRLSARVIRLELKVEEMTGLRHASRVVTDALRDGKRAHDDYGNRFSSTWKTIEDWKQTGDEN